MNLLQTVFYQSGYQSGEEGTRKLETRVGVDFDKPWCHVLVNHEVVSVDLKRERTPMRIKLSANCSHRVLSHLAKLRNEVFVEIAVNFVCIKILLKLLVT